ncbi:hypothetical protein K6U06_21515 [Acidiferrimicrobium sp. IK]|uniref:sensor histidine kinase n=1 Tax=Acidiferrimicrobium sp. IK TaxID=2871700 RepID=UPI0021CB2C9C|nr:histidine kinase [Acidiferrimicrobium sp. IK]MCU4186959.1 hypothetical protein [Acidiferrimicrobium sp. IK]
MADRPVDVLAPGRTAMGRTIGVFWLGFLALPLTSAFTRRRVGALHLAVVCAVVALFVGLYLGWFLSRRDWDPDTWRSGDRGDRIRVAVAAGLVAVVAFLSFFDSPGWSYCFTFAVWPVAWVGHRRARNVAGLVLLALATAAGAGGHLSDVLSVGALVLGVGASCMATWRQMEANAALRAATADQARTAVAEERLRFARDLHDLLGHSLSLIALKSEVASRLLPGDPRRAAAEVADIEAVARQALREVREAVGGYRRATVAVELAAASATLRAAGIRLDVDDGPPDGLAADVEAAVAWAIREGVTNVVRHSGARSCRVAFRRIAVPRSVAVEVTDDGGPGSFRASGASGTDPGSFCPGNGLHGLAERAALGGGHLEAGPLPGGGFRLELTVPLSASPALAEGPSDAATAAAGAALRLS